MSGLVPEIVFSDVDSDELEFIVNEEMQQYQIIHEQVIIQQNKEMNEIIGEVSTGPLLIATIFRF